VKLDADWGATILESWKRLVVKSQMTSKGAVSHELTPKNLSNAKSLKANM
jgi:NADPH:quinone reductase-like Zn-dependent oxidoreductase